MKFKLNAHVTVSCYCEVEAENERDAIEKSKALGTALGGISSGNEPTEWWIIEEADGEPQGIRAEQAD